MYRHLYAHGLVKALVWSSLWKTVASWTLCSRCHSGVWATFCVRCRPPAFLSCSDSCFFYTGFLKLKFSFVTYLSQFVGSSVWMRIKYLKSYFFKLLVYLQTLGILTLHSVDVRLYFVWSLRVPVSSHDTDSCQPLAPRPERRWTQFICYFFWLDKNWDILCLLSFKFSHLSKESRGKILGSHRGEYEGDCRLICTQSHHPGGGYNKHLWNVGRLLPVYTAISQQTAIFMLQ